MIKPAFDNYPNISQSFRITGILILGFILLSPFKWILNNVMNKEFAFLLYYLLAFGLSFWFVYSRRKNKTGAHSFNLAIESKPVIPLLIISTIVLNFGIIALLIDVIPMPESLEIAFTEAVNQKGFFTFVAMVVAAPILEELIFRGVILDGLLRVYTPFKSIVISSFLFGLVHLNLHQLIGGFLFGCFSGWVYYRTRSLLPSIIIHAVANLGGFITRYLVDIESLMDKSPVELYGGSTNLTLAIGGSIVIFLICIYYLKKEFLRVDIKNGNTQHWF